MQDILQSPGSNPVLSLENDLARASPAGGDGRDEMAQLGVFRLDVNRQAMARRVSERRRADRPDDGASRECSTELDLAHLSRGDLEQMLDLLGRREDCDVDLSPSDLDNGRW